MTAYITTRLQGIAFNLISDYNPCSYIAVFYSSHQRETDTGRTTFIHATKLIQLHDAIPSPDREDETDVDVVASDAGILKVTVHAKKEETSAKAFFIAVYLYPTNAARAKRNQ